MLQNNTFAARLATSRTGLSDWNSGRGKRLFDVIGATALQAAFAIPMAVIAVAVTIDNPAGPLFKQKRMGRDGEDFTLYKFRTVKEDICDQQTPKKVCRDDPRVTPLGRFLRKTRLDELPQLWNVMKGDMSLVGRRPLVPDYRKDFADLPGYDVVMKTKPGITGVAQIERSQRYSNNTPEGRRERTKIDVDYARNASLMTDIGILLKTTYTMLSPPHHVF